MPRRSRSAGICASPAAVCARAPRPLTSCPAISTCPVSALRKPARHSASSCWPLPSMPATPTISPARTLSDTPATAGSPRLERTCRSRASSTVAPGARSARVPSGAGTRPTMSSASCSCVKSRAMPPPTTRPARITVTRSASAATSASLCVISTMIVPASRSSRSTPNSSSTSCGVSTAVGSSRISPRPPRWSAFRISTRCCSPTDSPATRACGWMGSR